MRKHEGMFTSIRSLFEVRLYIYDLLRCAFIHEPTREFLDTIKHRREKLDIFDAEPGDSNRRLNQEEFECEIPYCENPDGEKADQDNEELAIIEESRLSHMQVNVKLYAEYRNWAPKPLADPSSSPIAHIAVGLVEIAKVEGPIVCHRAYSIYANACGIRRVGRQLG